MSHPEALQFVRRELEDVLRLSGVEFSRDKDVTLTPAHLEKLLYMGTCTQRFCIRTLRDVNLKIIGPTFSTESAIEESLRLCAASMIIRVAQEDFSLRLDAERSAAVRKGDIIALYPQAMHLDPEIYEDPQVRWTTFQLKRTQCTLIHAFVVLNCLHTCLKVRL